jgi:hypothetical protein
VGLGDNRNSARGALTEALGVKAQFGGGRFVLSSRLGFVGGFTWLLFVCLASVLRFMWFFVFVCLQFFLSRVMLVLVPGAIFFV